MEWIIRLVNQIPLEGKDEVIQAFYYFYVPVVVTKQGRIYEIGEAERVLGDDVKIGGTDGDDA